MRPLTRRWPLLVAALASGALLTTSAPDLGSAETAPTVRAQAAALTRSESGALLELYAAESALARARAEADALARRSDALARDEASLRRRTGIVRRSLQASQARVAALLRELYIQGETDPISVILGATSVDEAVAGIDGLTRSAAQNRRLGAEAAARSERLARLGIELDGRRADLARAETAAAVSVRRLEAAVAGRAATVADIRRKQSLTAQRLASLEQQAQVAQKRSGAIAAAAAAPAATETTAAPPATVPATQPSASPAAGTRTLVVDAVAYHLPGKTASGLPVGVGVIAVDPSVIPLGTRVFVPGYGPAVAADVGTAIKGNIIDLWMPSTAAANAWGRRTVTITIYG